jgi:hypothetical protein
MTNRLFISSFKMSRNISYIAVRVLLGIGLSATLSLVYTQFFWQEDLATYGEQLPELWQKADSCDVLYFAESSNATYADTDTSQKSISEYFADHVPNKKVCALNKGAVHAGVFLALIKQIPDSSKVKTIIVTMNLRSFDAAWVHSELETPLMKSNVLYAKRNPLLNKLFMSFGYYDHQTKEERNAHVEHQWRYDTLNFPFEYPYRTVRAWDDGFANGGYEIIDDTIWSYEKVSLACHYIKTYAFQIDTLTNPRIKDFDEIVKVAKAKKLQLVFNLLAENVEYADSLVGKPLSYLMYQNKNLLMDRYNKDGVTVVDNFDIVAGYNFMDQNWTTEHYFAEGRKQIADRLSLYVKIP